MIKETIPVWQIKIEREREREGGGINNSNQKLNTHYLTPNLATCKQCSDKVISSQQYQQTVFKQNSQTLLTMNGRKAITTH